MSRRLSFESAETGEAALNSIEESMEAHDGLISVQVIIQDGKFVVATAEADIDEVM